MEPFREVLPRGGDIVGHTRPRHWRPAVILWGALGCEKWPDRSDLTANVDIVVTTVV